MRYNGKIEKINHIVISDPSYSEAVCCRYEKDKLNESDWLIDFDINLFEEPLINDTTLKGTEFFLLLYKDKKICELKDNGTIRYLKGISLEETEIGMDTACIALGINENAKEINRSKEDWQPRCSLKTFTDGIFGTVKEGKIDNEIVFIWVSGYLDEDTGYSMQDIVEYLQYQFNITELSKNVENNIEMEL